MRPERILLMVVLMMGCGGPSVKERTQKPFHPVRHRKVVVIPFQVLGDLTAQDGEILQGWVERDLLEKEYDVRPWTDVDLRVKDHPRQGGETQESILYEACRDLGIRGIWNARVRLTPEDGEYHLSMVLRLTDPSSGLWLLEVTGEDRLEGRDRLAWRDLLDRVLAEVPPQESASER